MNRSSWFKLLVKCEQEFWCETEQQGIEGEREEIPGVSQGGDEGYGGHGPVVAEGGGAHEEHHVEYREVEEGESSGEATVTVRCRVVSPGEGWQFPSQKYRPQTEDDDEAEADPEDCPLFVLVWEVRINDVQQTADCQHGHSLLLSQHGEGCQDGRGQAGAEGLVTQQGEEGEQGGEDVSPAHHPGHGLAVHGQDGEDEAGQLGQAGAVGAEAAQQVGEQESDQAVQQDVGQVEAQGVGPSQHPVQLEGEAGERPVGLVGAGVGERNAPVVRGQQGGEGGGPADDRIVQDAGSATQELSTGGSSLYKSSRPPEDFQKFTLFIKKIKLCFVRRPNISIFSSPTLTMKDNDQQPTYCYF